ncbi:MAG: hypothetical protein A2942_04360 [Candidatus Lloydbacteria bacterium RIFCSPLOWO2_01_FULL_50_20]|uniref:Succinylglutamate desuccinylase/Aspartoacylase catalytic domain-containing protein n=1 Tax=Candidatus Lloydbacteria bacterium RIFCSPLOWO2_01_FULL_50_20 TaxID=1798665 RepID=A0A1G2DDC6_9BACT|nr:MAG: hypothetical protein A2942_04360 [Candidatus Lloydbacteria bacterium RIFCSPLOWO2_01_FULL_50_20]
MAGLYGNERSPVRALGHKGLDFVLGNPKAYERNIRFIDRDLNASFGVSDSSYESGRATEILNEINGGDVVIDFHTTTAPGVPFAVLTE